MASARDPDVSPAPRTVLVWRSLLRIMHYGRRFGPFARPRPQRAFSKRACLGQHCRPTHADGWICRCKPLISNTRMSTDGR